MPLFHLFYDNKTIESSKTEIVESGLITQKYITNKDLGARVTILDIVAGP